jgi:hypothetical protein
MSRELFLVILNGVRDYDDYFEAKYDDYIGGCCLTGSLDLALLLWYGRNKNDINVLHCSQVFSRLTERTFPQIFYETNGNPYDKGYYPAGGIYPSWANFVKTVRNHADEKCKRCAKEQEAARKDVERTFGVLQSRWSIVQYPTRTWSLERM